MRFGAGLVTTIIMPTDTPAAAVAQNPNHRLWLDTWDLIRRSDKVLELVQEFITTAGRAQGELDLFIKTYSGEGKGGVIYRQTPWYAEKKRNLETARDAAISNLLTATLTLADLLIQALLKMNHWILQLVVDLKETGAIANLPLFKSEIEDMLLSIEPNAAAMNVAGQIIGARVAEAFNGYRQQRNALETLLDGLKDLGLNVTVVVPDVNTPAPEWLKYVVWGSIAAAVVAVAGTVVYFIPRPRG